MMTDPLGDLLARIRNAYQAGHGRMQGKLVGLITVADGS